MLRLPTENTLDREEKIMAEWLKTSLIDIVELIGGGTPKTSKTEYWGGNINWLSVKDFNNENRYVYSTEKTITEEGLNNSSTKLLRKDDIIISARGTVGELAMIPFPMAFNQSCYGIRAKDDINSTFLYYLIKHSVRKLKAITHGSVFDTITRDTFANIEVAIPDIETQHRVAKMLADIDDKVENNQRINNNLEQQAQAIFDNMFPNISNGSCAIGDYIMPKRGKSLLSKNAIFGDVPVIAGGLEPSTYHNVANTQSPVLAISASGANAGYVSLWNIPIWSSDSSYIDSSMTDDVYFWYVLLKKRQKEIFDAQTGSAQPHIYPQHIASMSISNLDIEEVHSYTSIVTPIFEMIGHNKDENARLATTRDTLLPKLMSGELDVSDIEI